MSEWVKLTAILPGDVWQIWESVVDTLEQENVTHENEQVRNGIIVEILCAEYLAGNHGNGS